MGLKHEVWYSIAWGTVNSLGVISEVNNTIFNSLMIIRSWILFVKHSIFPLSSRLPAQRAWAFASFKLISVMGILDKKLHVLGDMHMNDDGCIILYVEY